LASWSSAALGGAGRSDDESEWGLSGIRKHAIMSTLLVRKSLEHTAEEYESVTMTARIENVLEPELRRVETPIHQIITRCGGAIRSADVGLV
jgi:hypothetical protein